MTRVRKLHGQKATAMAARCNVQFRWCTTRRQWLRGTLATAAGGLLVGCGERREGASPVEAVWGRQGFSDGRLQKPRAMTIDAEGRLYIVDMTSRIQVFDGEGRFLRGWKTPVCANGRPTGLSIDRQGRLLVADTHYYRVLVYAPEGELLRTIGGEKGNRPGQFGWVTDVVADAEGNLFVSEYGEFDRIQKLAADGRYLTEWGSHGSAGGEFARPQSMKLDGQQRLWVADACNHRVQVFDGEGRLLRMWGEHGMGPGQLAYPYDLVLNRAGEVYVCEYGNHRVQKFTAEGRSLGCWGGEGREAGQLYNPWAIVLDADERLYVLDTNNHRVQRTRF